MNVAVATSIDLIGIKVLPSDIHVSFLPYAHSMEQCLTGALLSAGAKIGYFAGEILKLLDDVKVLQPTIFMAVPRLLNKIYAKITANVAEAGGAKAQLFNTAIQTKI